MKLTLLHGSYSGALVLIAEPSRADGMVLPSTVVKFDKSSDIEKETKLTQEHGPRWGPTYPRVLDCKLQDAGAEARGILQIELCGGRFGVPSLTREAPVMTFEHLLMGFLEGCDATRNLGETQRNDAGCNTSRGVVKARTGAAQPLREVPHA